MMNNQTMLSQESITQRNRIIDEHRREIMAMRRIEKEIEDKLSANDPSWRQLQPQREVHYRRIEPLIRKYWDWIPSVPLSRCPYCDDILERCFDPVDLNGFWWMDRTQRPVEEPKACPHFCLLSGAVDLSDQEVKGGLFECCPGPGVPFVIPRILQMPAMKAVLTSFKMSCGYTAYPIAYFSEKHVPGGHLTQSWSRKEYRFHTDDGRSGWDIKVDDYDYELSGWLQKGKLWWLDKNRKLVDPQSSETDCPFVDLPGRRRPQRILDNTLYEL